jgi:hypothetical protein
MDLGIDHWSRLCGILGVCGVKVALDVMTICVLAIEYSVLW